MNKWIGKRTLQSNKFEIKTRNTYCNRLISHTYHMWWWGHSLFNISSPGPVLHGTKWLLWRPHRQSLTLHSMCRINKGLIKREAQYIIEGRGARAGSFGPPTYIHFRLPITSSWIFDSIKYFVLLNKTVSLAWHFVPLAMKLFVSSTSYISDIIVPYFRQLGVVSSPRNLGFSPGKLHVTLTEEVALKHVLLLIPSVLPC
jgi:hypothetical protein